MTRARFAGLLLVLVACSAGSHQERAAAPAPRPLDGGWCAASRAVDKQSNKIGRLFSSDAAPREIESVIRGLAGLAEAAAIVAPMEIRSDALVSAGSLRRFVEVLDRADWDITLVPEQALVTFADPDTRAANDRVMAYNARACTAV